MPLRLKDRAVGTGEGGVRWLALFDPFRVVVVFRYVVINIRPFQGQCRSGQRAAIRSFQLRISLCSPGTLSRKIQLYKKADSPEPAFQKKC